MSVAERGAVDVAGLRERMKRAQTCSCPVGHDLYDVPMTVGELRTVLDALDQATARVAGLEVDAARWRALRAIHTCTMKFCPIRLVMKRAEAAALASAAGLDAAR